MGTATFSNGESGLMKKPLYIVRPDSRYFHPAKFDERVPFAVEAARFTFKTAMKHCRENGWDPDCIERAPEQFLVVMHHACKVRA